MMMRKMLKRHRVIVTGDILTLNDDGDDDDNDDDDDDDYDAYYDDKIMIFSSSGSIWDTGKKLFNYIREQNFTGR